MTPIPRPLAPIVATLALLLLAQLPSATAAGSCPVDTTPDFTDACYHQYILYDVDQPEVDVLILPSADPYVLRDASTLKQSVEAWESGINTLAPGWLADGLNIYAYNVGIDATPAAALWDPEVVVVTAEANPFILAGIGEQLPVSWCHGIPSPLTAQGLAALPGFHSHPGSSWGSVAASCDSGGWVCFVVNTNFLWLPDEANRRDLYDLDSHEFGHCLGIGHVGDALDFTAARYPQDDIMSYENDGHDAGRALCVSTLDILALRQVYGALLGQSGYPAKPAGTYVHQDPAAWADVTCAEPDGGFLDVPSSAALAVRGHSHFRPLHATPHLLR